MWSQELQEYTGTKNKVSYLSCFYLPHTYLIEDDSEVEFMQLNEMCKNLALS